MNLLLVESPAKSKTIEKYLGKDFKVMATVGHMRDLDSTDDAIDTEHGFEMKWKVMPGKEKNLKAIADMMKKCDALYLAPDLDREGEAIAWHTLEMLKNKKVLEGKKVHRITFNEITKKAVLKAIEQPREIDMNLVGAYLARRALDRLMGFNLSPILWRKLPGSKSAGRVQSVALRLLCQREDEIEKFQSVEYWSIEADFKTSENKTFSSKLSTFDGKKLDKLDIKNKDEADKILSNLENSNFTVDSVEKKQTTRRPFAPFTTSTLQQEASRKLGFSAKQTMQTAQRLYEGIDLGGEHLGLITYMRTDSTNLAAEALDEIKQTVLKFYGEKYTPDKPNFYGKKSKNAQEAHEAIRPTHFDKTPKQVKPFLDAGQYKLYELIWKRAVASQMASAIIDNVAVNITDNDNKSVFRSTGSMINFDGFLVLYNETKDEKDDEENGNMLPVMNEGQPLEKEKMEGVQHFTQAPPRFSEATLVKKMEELGIGRPSTYASILSVIQDRNYVSLEKKRFICEERGRIVIAFLENFFDKYVDYSFTADMEDYLDHISHGDRTWTDVLEGFWSHFKERIDSVKEIHIEDVIESLNQKLSHHLFPRKEGISEDEARVCPECKNGKLSLKLGKFGGFIGCSNYPECRYTRQLSIDADEKYIEEKNKIGEGKELGEIKGEKIYIKEGPYGFYVQLGELSADAKQKPKRSAIPKFLNVEDIDEKKAKFLLALPKKVAKDEDGNDILIGIGRFGPYLKKGERDFVSIPAGTDIFAVKNDVALEIIKNAKSNPSGRTSNRPTGESLGNYKDTKNDVLYYEKGRYGPYVKCGKKIASVNKDYQNRIAAGEKMTLEMASEILDAKK